jgi:glucose/arabinose dehydrogenase
LSARVALLASLAIAMLAAGACRKHAVATSASGGCDAAIKLPPGFCATVFAESAGPVRHIAVRSNGDVFVGALDQRRIPGGVLAFRDTDKDGHADVEEKFGDAGVHGVVLSGDSVLYASTASAVLRYHLTDSLIPHKRVDTIVAGLAARPIPDHSLAIDLRGNLIVNVGALSDGCVANDQPQTPAKDPCPDLQTSGGIWSFRPERSNQTIAEGNRIATGLYNAMALAVNPGDTTIYAVSHGRDGLHDAWPALYSDVDAATAAWEEMVRITTVRADFGWPYCYYNGLKVSRYVAPEYGGDKQRTDRCERMIQPLFAFPAHWAPMAMLFYTGKMFPAQYKDGAFVAFHGSAKRSPLPDEGYEIAFVRFKDGYAVDDVPFATGFAGDIVSAQGAEHRASGLAQGPDGALYVSDDKGGRIWRITYAQPRR